MRFRARWRRERAGHGHRIQKAAKPRRGGAPRAVAMADRVAKFLDLDPAVLAHVRAGGDCPSARWLSRLRGRSSLAQRDVIREVSAPLADG